MTGAEAALLPRAAKSRSPQDLRRASRSSAAVARRRTTSRQGLAFVVVRQFPAEQNAQRNCSTAILRTASLVLGVPSKTLLQADLHHGGVTVRQADQFRFVAEFLTTLGVR